MTKLVCSGCGRSVDVDKVHGNEICKECNKPMKKVIGDSAQEIVESSEEKKESKITLPTSENLCGELPDFSNN